MKKFLFTALLAVTTLVSFPRSAHAYLIVCSQDMECNPGYNTTGEAMLQVVGCVLLLPICLLDADSAAGINKQDLLDNGYSEAQVAHLMKEQSTLTTLLKGQNKSIIFEGGRQENNVEEVLRSVNPRVSTEYIQFFTEAQGLN